MTRSAELTCPCCDGKGTVENQREQQMKALAAVCADFDDRDLEEVEYYAAYLKARRRRVR